jgi:hypothetical protein
VLSELTSPDLQIRAVHLRDLLRAPGGPLKRADRVRANRHEMDKRARAGWACADSGVDTAVVPQGDPTIPPALVWGPGCPQHSDVMLSPLWPFRVRRPEPAGDRHIDSLRWREVALNPRSLLSNVAGHVHVSVVWEGGCLLAVARLTTSDIGCGTVRRIRTAPAFPAAACDSCDRCDTLGVIPSQFAMPRGSKFYHHDLRRRPANEPRPVLQHQMSHARRRPYAKSSLLPTDRGRRRLREVGLTSTLRRRTNS